MVRCGGHKALKVLDHDHSELFGPVWSALLLALLVHPHPANPCQSVLPSGRSRFHPRRSIALHVGTSLRDDRVSNAKVQNSKSLILLVPDGSG